MSRARRTGAFYAPGMSADSEASRRLRRAYEEAWAARSNSGNSDEVLRARLRAHQLFEVLDETTPIHGFIFDLWRRDVPPERVGREVWKATGRVALQLISTGRSRWHGATRRIPGTVPCRTGQYRLPYDETGLPSRHAGPVCGACHLMLVTP